MFKELIVLADELDKCGEKEAADFIDKLVKSAVSEEGIEDDLPLTPLVPEAKEEMEEEGFPAEKTKVDFHSRTGPELVKRLARFFTLNPEPVKWSDEDRAKVLEAMEVLKG